MDAYDQHSSRLVPQRTAKGTVSSCKSASTALSQNPPTLSEIHDTPIQATTVLVVLKAE